MRNNYSKEFCIFVKENINKYTREELRKIVQEKFNIRMSSEAFRRYISYHFKEKSKGYDKSKVRKNVCKYKIGDERISTVGTFIKVDQPDKWRLKHRVMYEKYHNCKLKDDECIIFLNQNKNDFSKENLKKISFKEFMWLHNNKIFSSNPKLTELGLLSVKLMIKAKGIVEE